MKLYFSPGACSLIPHIVLEECSQKSGLRYATQKVDLKTHTVEGQDYYKVNKKGSVPVLELDNGERLTEAAVVSQYIADQSPQAKLIPAMGTWERYRLQEWMNFLATELHKNFGPLFNPAFPEEAKTMNRETLKKKFGIAAARLEERSYLMGENLSVADAYLFVMLLWAKKKEVDLSSYKSLAQFTERMRERPAVRSALEQEGLN